MIQKTLARLASTPALVLAISIIVFLTVYLPWARFTSPRIYSADRSHLVIGEPHPDADDSGIERGGMGVSILAVVAACLGLASGAARRSAVAARVLAASAALVIVWALFRLFGAAHALEWRTWPRRDADDVIIVEGADYGLCATFAALGAEAALVLVLMRNAFRRRRARLPEASAAIGRAD